MDPLKLQQRLNDLGYTIEPMYPNIGPKTRKAIKSFQKDNGLEVDGIVGPITLLKLFPEEAQQERTSQLVISLKSLQAIINFEISSKAYYNKALKSPAYPGLGSGITIGIGYDLGYHSAQQIQGDWKEHVASQILRRIVGVAGLRGQDAKNKLNSLRDISIDYNTAATVFYESSIPKHAELAVKAYPGLLQITPDAAGAVLSLVYNRGTSKSGASRTEMAALGQLIRNKDYTGMACDVEKMKRLWDGISEDGMEKRVQGLLDRRDQEAALIRGSLRQYADNELIKINI